MSACDGQTDGRTDGRTDISIVASTGLAATLTPCKNLFTFSRAEKFSESSTAAATAVVSVQWTFPSSSSRVFFMSCLIVLLFEQIKNVCKNVRKASEQIAFFAQSQT